MKNQDKINIDDAIDFIDECASFEGTELGETWVMLCQLWRHRDYLNEPMYKALEDEIKKTFKYLKENSKIETREETQVVTIKELVFTNE